MKTIMLMFTVLVVLFQGNSHAQMIRIDYTGNSVNRAADESWLNPGGSSYLGGPIGNDAMLYGASQFTVDSPEGVFYMSINVQQSSMSPYFFITPPNYSENMNVTFSLIEGTGNNSGTDIPILHFPYPNGATLGSADLIFTTVAGQFVTDYNNLLVPLQAELIPGDTYWIAASVDGSGGQNWGGPADSGGSTLNYSVGLEGAAAPVPEPPTFWLFLMVVVGFVILRRNNVFRRLV